MTAQATEYHTQQVHYLRKTITFASDGAGAVTVGKLPAGALVVGAGAVVTTAFDGTSPILDIGTSGDGDGFATNLSLGTVGNIVWDELATSDDLYSTSEVTVTADMSATGNNSTAGSCEVYVQFLADNAMSGAD